MPKEATVSDSTRNPEILVLEYPVNGAELYFAAVTFTESIAVAICLVEAAVFDECVVFINYEKLHVDFETVLAAIDDFCEFQVQWRTTGACRINLEANPYELAIFFNSMLPIAVLNVIKA